jgi:predicted ArsR family transcriptional regulator
MERTFWQKLEGTTEQVLTQLKKLVEEGNIRRVVVKQKGRTVAEFPLTAGVIGGVIAPVAAAIGALTALVTGCSIEVEKTVTEPEPTPVP